MIDYHVIVCFLEEHFGEFAEYCGDENAAEEILDDLRVAGEMKTENSAKGASNEQH